MSIRLERHAVGVLVTGLVLLSAAALLVLPGVAVAQGTAPVQDEAQDANRNTGAAFPGAADDPSSTSVRESVREGAARLVVKPGDSLWSIAQERLSTEDATPRQIGDEVERIIDLNRDLVGGNPDLILPGQELLLAPAPAETPTAQTEVAIPEAVESEAAEAPVAQTEGAEPEAAPFEPFAEPDSVARRLIGWGIVVLPSVLTILMVWTRTTRRARFAGRRRHSLLRRPSQELRRLLYPDERILAWNLNNRTLPSGFGFTKALEDRYQDNPNANGSPAGSSALGTTRTLRQVSATAAYNPQILYYSRQAFRTKVRSAVADEEEKRWRRSTKKEYAHGY